MILQTSTGMQNGVQKLSALPLGHAAKVSAVTLDSFLGSRLCSLGVCVNDFIVIKSKSFFNGTFRVEVYRDTGFKVTLAIRHAEAEAIMVKVEKS